MSIKVALGELRLVLANLVAFFHNQQDTNLLINTCWTAKDILGHLTYWHESFARNISDLVNELNPSPLKGKLSEVNRDSVKSTHAITVDDLVSRIRSAQHTIEAHIYNEKIDLIPYRKGSRPYSRLEHLEVVTDHIQKHLQQIQKAYKSHVTSKEQITTPSTK